MKYLSSSERTGGGSLYTPWSNEEELKTVRDWLYSKDSSERRKGCHRVSAWQARGVVPLAVEFTADIVNCLLLKEEESTSGCCHGDVVSLSFAMFITKWVWLISGWSLLMICILSLDLLMVCLILVVAMAMKIPQYIMLLIE